MKYMSIRKASFSAKGTELEKLYKDRIEGDSTYVFGFDIHGNPAFVVLHPSMHEQIVNIYKKSYSIEKLRSELPGIAVKWYEQFILIDEIGLTNEMENVHSTRQEITETFDSVTNATHSKAELRFVGMVEKYINLRNQAECQLMTCSDIRNLYDDFILNEVLKEDPKDMPDGEVFRAKPVSVQNKHGEIIHEGVYPEKEILRLMEVALKELNNPEVDMLVRVAAFHYVFGYIHPFYNGNGRISRFISSYLLSRELNTLAGMRLSYVIKNNKAAYDRLFKETNELRNKGDLTDFVSGFLEYVDTALDDIIRALSEGRDHIKLILDVIGSIPKYKKYYDMLKFLAINALFAERGLTVEELMQLTQKGRNYIDNALHLFDGESGEVKKTKIGKRNHYSLNIDAFIDAGAME